MSLDIVDLLRLGFLGAAAAVLLLYSIPALRSRFLAYGARITPPTTTETEKHQSTTTKPPPTTNPLTALLDRLAALRVPHNYFTSFYYTSLTLSLLWLLDYTISLPLTTHLLLPHLSLTRPSTPFHRTLLTWLCLTLHSTRRLYESHTFATPSSSKMWLGHCALGLAFYTALSPAIWIEGLPALLSHTFTIADLSVSGLSFRTLLSLTLFVLASGIQHDAHAYLHALKTLPNTPTPTPTTTSNYKLPQHPAFHLTLTPHYFAECLIYLSWAFLAAPEGQWVNRTLLCALGFVVANLGVTASGTREWYVGRFGRRAVQGRARMVPFVW